jgi:hypothetical protein
MDMYKPKKDSSFYMLVFLAVCSLATWAFLKFYRPVMVEAACSEMALRSSSGGSQLLEIYYPDADYDTLKANCLEGVY